MSLYCIYNNDWELWQDSGRFETDEEAAAWFRSLYPETDTHELLKVVDTKDKQNV